jgi:hypothetical protein
MDTNAIFVNRSRYKFITEQFISIFQDSYLKGNVYYFVF